MKNKIQIFLFLVNLLNDLDFIISIFPLHDKEDIKLIERDWFMSKDALFKSQDIRKRKIFDSLKINFDKLFLRKGSKLFR
jgi:hypothetical protein